ncbi:transposase family protein [Streptomyces sp. MBT84]|uniref:transposase family protein n=2 Tax=unclassified Streptomyces TaxID=2593676 RepID=UPI0027E04D6E|nr:transposase family protein [Streptomyces sp. MBT84]
MFIDRLLATLVHLRHGAMHDVLACWFQVDRSTITRAINEVRPLLAERGCTISPDVRLRTLADVVDQLDASGKTGIIDGTEIRVRRPAAGRKDRDKFISGKNKQNAVKSMVVTDGDGRPLWCSPAKPASCADITHARELGLARLLADGPRGRDPRRCQLPRAGDTNRRTRSDTTTPQVQEERPGLVQSLKWVGWYNAERLHSALGYAPPRNSKPRTTVPWPPRTAPEDTQTGRYETRGSSPLPGLVSGPPLWPGCSYGSLRLLLIAGLHLRRPRRCRQSLDQHLTASRRCSSVSPDSVISRSAVR